MMNEYQTSAEFEKLLAAYRALTHRRNVLEIGSMMGVTLREWFDSGEDGMTLISIDKIVPPSDERHLAQTRAHAEWEKWIEDGKKVTAIDGHSQDPAVIAKVRALAPYIDFLFIDADHSYSGVKADYDNYAPLVRPGGLIAFHDVTCIADVRQFWYEVRGNHFTEYCELGGMGIGTITKPLIIPKLHVITAYSREGNLPLLEASLEDGREFFDIHWHIVADASKITASDTWEEDASFEMCHDCGIAGSGQINQALDSITDGWVYVLDDDNVIHPDFFVELHREIAKGEKLAFAFAQETGGGVRQVGPSAMKECSIDQAQFVVQRDFIDDERYISRYSKDGEMAERLYKKDPGAWGFSSHVCTYYNKLR